MFPLRTCHNIGIVSVSVLGLALATAACGGAARGGGTGPTPGLWSVGVFMIPNPAMLGSTVQATVLGFDQAGKEMTIAGVPATWSSSSQAVATVGSNTAFVVDVATVGEGQAQISCKVSGVSGQATLTVIKNVVASIGVTPSIVTLKLSLGGMVLSADPIDANGNVVTSAQLPPGPGTFNSWTTSDRNIVNVNQFGMITPVAVGSATITASNYGRSGTAAVTVTP